MQGSVESPEDRQSRMLRQRGATILALFGGLWAVVAASGVPSGAAWSVCGVAAAVAVALLVLGHRSGTAVRERVRRQPQGWHRRVGLVNLTQILVIAMVVVVCLVTELPQLVAPLACLIVGLHFLPLAGLFDQPQYRWTATGLCVAAVTSLLVLVVGPSMEVARIVVGSVAAATLWATSLRLALRS